MNVELITASGARTSLWLDTASEVGKGGQARLCRLRKQQNGPFEPYLVAKVLYEAEEARPRVEALMHLDVDWTKWRTGGWSITWPLALIVDGNEKFLGFVMQLLTKDKYAPFGDAVAFYGAARDRLAPDRGWDWQVDIAIDLAQTVMRAADRDILIPDLSMPNLAVHILGKAVILDADSLCFTDASGTRHAPSYARTEYQAPEQLTGDEVVTKDSMSFALGVNITQLLVGTHPFAGRPRDYPLDKPIEEMDNVLSRTSWINDSSVGLPAGSFTQVERLLSPRLRDMMGALGEDPGDGRPKLEEWLPALEELKVGLQVCDKSDKHVKYRGCVGCVWCDHRPGSFAIPRPPANRKTSMPSSDDLVERFRSTGAGQPTRSASPQRASPLPIVASASSDLGVFDHLFYAARQNKGVTTLIVLAVITILALVIFL